MRFIVMSVTAVCVLFLIKLRWPKRKNFIIIIIVIVIVIVNRYRYRYHAFFFQNQKHQLLMLFKVYSGDGQTTCNKEN